MGHTIYTLKDGKQVDSVTTVISNNLGWNKKQLVNWSKTLALEAGVDSDIEVMSAALIGTITHNLIESRIKKTPPPSLKNYDETTLEQVYSAFKAFCAWEKEWKPEYIHNELKLTSELYKYGGTIDIIAKKDDKYHILDIKTSNHMHAEMCIQLAAYKNLYEANFAVEIHTNNIIKLDKFESTHNFVTFTPEETKAGWEVFENLLKINSLRPSFSNI